MNATRGATGRGLVLGVATLVATVSFAACKSGDGGGSGAAATGAAPAAVGDVVRYPGETPETGSYVAWQAVRARKAADANAETVMIIQPGSGLVRVARYGGYTLIQWGTPQGPKQAWVETAQMIRPIYYDAGVGTGSFGASNFGGQPVTGVGATPQPQPVATTPPPPPPRPIATVPPATTAKPPTKGATPKPPGK